MNKKHKFKIGDWITYGDFTFQVADIVDDVLFNEAYFTQDLRNLEHVHINDAQLWQPKTDDYCWFRDYKTITPVLGKFEEIKENGFYGMKKDHQNKGVKFFQYCEPFIGELPTNIKG